MKFKSILIGFVIGFLIGAVAGYGGSSGQTMTLQNQVNLLKSEADKVPALEQQLGSMTAEKNALQRQITAMNSEKITLQNQVSSIQNQIQTLESEKQTLQNEVNDLTREVAQLQESELAKAVAEKDAEITQLKAQVVGLNVQINNLQTQIAALQSSSVSLIAISFARTQDTSSLLRYWIGKANQTIRVCVYAFTQDALGDAIIAAKNRGIAIQVYIDNQYVSSTGSEYPKLQAAGISIKSDDRSAYMHHKFVIIDGYIVGTGSYNWSQAAEDENDENLVILKSQSLAQAYLGEFNRLWG